MLGRLGVGLIVAAGVAPLLGLSLAYLTVGVLAGLGLLYFDER
jgi:hypothetical protein